MIFFALVFVFAFLRESFCSANLILWRLFLTQDDFAMAHELVVQPQTVFICGCLAARTRRAAEQAHAGRRLKNVRRKRTPVHIEFHSQIACVGDPGNLVAFIKHDDLRNESNEYGTFSHFLCGPCGSGPKLLILSVHSDDSIFSGENSCELRHNAREFPLFFLCLLRSFISPRCSYSSGRFTGITWSPAWPCWW